LESVVYFLIILYRPLWVFTKLLKMQIKIYLINVKKFLKTKKKKKINKYHNLVNALQYTLLLQ